jgi:hypothetical protein
LDSPLAKGLIKGNGEERNHNREGKAIPVSRIRKNHKRESIREKT